jgi:hypothetical protein
MSLLKTIFLPQKLNSIKKTTKKSQMLYNTASTKGEKAGTGLPAGLVE